MSVRLCVNPEDFRDAPFTSCSTPSALGLLCSSSQPPGSYQVHAVQLLSTHQGHDKAVGFVDLQLPPAAQDAAQQLQLLLLVWHDLELPHSLLCRKASGQRTFAPGVQRGKLFGLIPSGSKLWVGSAGALPQGPARSTRASTVQLKLKRWQPQQQDDQSAGSSSLCQQQHAHSKAWRLSFSDVPAGTEPPASIPSVTLDVVLRRSAAHTAAQGAASAAAAASAASPRSHLVPGPSSKPCPAYHGMSPADLQHDSNSVVHFKYIISSTSQQQQGQQQQGPKERVLVDTLPCGTCPLCGHKCHLLHGLKLHLEHCHVHHR